VVLTLDPKGADVPDDPQRGLDTADVAAAVTAWAAAMALPRTDRRSGERVFFSGPLDAVLVGRTIPSPHSTTGVRIVGRRGYGVSE
jgi:hypothetical protein